MKKYIVYDLTGKILRTGSCPDDMMEIQAHGDEMVLEGIADDIKHRIKDGKIVEHIKTSKEIEDALTFSSEQEKEQKIRTKMNEILRKMAIEELEKESKT